jgi:hypothetical protein
MCARKGGVLYASRHGSDRCHLGPCESFGISAHGPLELNEADRGFIELAQKIQERGDDVVIFAVPYPGALVVLEEYARRLGLVVQPLPREE